MLRTGVADMKGIYCVLGMHKSGTTLLAQVLHQSGISMGDFDLNGTYETGHKFERVEFKALNKEILQAGTNHSLDTVARVPTETIPERFYAIAREHSRALSARHDSWGFKDPRSALLVEFWLSVLPDLRFVVIVRDPKEVCLHYLNQKKASGFRSAYLWSKKCLNAWQTYNGQIHSFVKSLEADRYIVLTYTELMQDDQELARLQAFVGSPISDARRLAAYRSKGPWQLGIRSAMFSSFVKGVRVQKLYHDLVKLGKRTIV